MMLRHSREIEHLLNIGPGTSCWTWMPQLIIDKLCLQRLTEANSRLHPKQHSIFGMIETDIVDKNWPKLYLRAESGFVNRLCTTA